MNEENRNFLQYAVSRERELKMNKELDLDECAAQSEKAIRELNFLKNQLQMLRKQIDTAPKVISLEADFEFMTWTFKISGDVQVGSGTYALVRLL